MKPEKFITITKMCMHTQISCKYGNLVFLRYQHHIEHAGTYTGSNTEMLHLALGISFLSTYKLGFPCRSS
jgi:hypothetical protein